MQRYILITCTVVLFTASLAGQSAEDESIRLKQEVTRVTSEGRTGQELSAGQTDWQDRGQAHLSVGTAFTAAGGWGSGMGFYAMPSYSLSLTPRISVHGGLIATTYTGFGTPPYLPEAAQTPVFKSLAVYGAASYRMSDRLLLHGAGVKNLVHTPVPNGLYHAPDHFSLGATYKLGDNISLGATIRMDRGTSFYPVSPFQGSPFGAPYASPYYW